MGSQDPGRAEEVWYHSIDLGGQGVTRGLFDHRDLVSRLTLPPSLHGKRCLDLASSDGFFAFEMARRGAAEVVSVDLEDSTKRDYPGAPVAGRPTGPSARRRFDRAQAALGLDVVRVDANIYDVGSLGLGTFDVVFVGNILLHLQDPVRALRSAREVVSGELFSFEPILLAQSVLRRRTAVAHLATGPEPRWWTLNARGHWRLLESAGFRVVESSWPLFQQFGAWRSRRPHGREEWRSVARNPFEQSYMWLWIRQVGVPSSLLRAVPAG